MGKVISVKNHEARVISAGAMSLMPGLNHRINEEQFHRACEQYPAFGNHYESGALEIIGEAKVNVDLKGDDKNFSSNENSTPSKKNQEKPPVKGPEPQQSEEVDDSLGLSKLNAKEAINLIGKTEDVSLLESWIDGEDRSTVIKALEDRLEELESKVS